MGKDEIKSDDHCPDCVEGEDTSPDHCPDCVEGEDTSPDPVPNETVECCSCCCSCSSSESENETARNSQLPMGNQLLLNIEQQKKYLLSNLSILQTNREPATIQHILQFVEALNHSTDFLRRYNLQEDFCMECMLSEPASACCTSGISQLNINDNSYDSCEECSRTEESRYQRCPPQECSDCVSSAKTINFGRQRTTNRRQRRRRRRQQNVRRTLPRAISQSCASNDSSSASRDPGANSCGIDCLDCQADRRNSPDCEQNTNNDNHDTNCEDCVREEASRRCETLKSKVPSVICHNNTNEDSDYCEECARENTPSSSCSYSGYENYGRSRRRRNVPRRNPSERDIGSELSCTCCSRPESSQHGSRVTRNDQSKKKKMSKKPECDQSESSDLCSERGKNQSAECSCAECRVNSECSDESCEECKFQHSNRKSKKK